MGWRGWRRRRQLRMARWGKIQNQQPITIYLMACGATGQTRPELKSVAIVCVACVRRRRSEHRAPCISPTVDYSGNHLPPVPCKSCQCAHEQRLTHHTTLRPSTFPGPWIAVGCIIAAFLCRADTSLLCRAAAAAAAAAVPACVGRGACSGGGGGAGAVSNPLVNLQREVTAGCH